MLHINTCGCGQRSCWHEYPERGWIQFLILRVLYENPTYGYKVLEALKEKSLGSYRLETGSITGSPDIFAKVLGRWIMQ